MGYLHAVGTRVCQPDRRIIGTPVFGTGHFASTWLGASTPARSVELYPFFPRSTTFSSRIPRDLTQVYASGLFKARISGKRRKHQSLGVPSVKTSLHFQWIY